MGGRGSVSSIGGRPVSKMGAKIFYNAAKKSEALRTKAAQSGKIDFIDKIDGVKEATRVKNYYSDRVSELQRKIAKLGSAEELYKNQKLAREYKNILTANNKAADKMHEFSHREEKGNTNIHDVSRTTTTYDRARKRRMSNFDSWFYGSKSK